MDVPFFCIQEGLSERVIFDFKSSDLQKEQQINYLERNTTIQYGFDKKNNNNHGIQQQNKPQTNVYPVRKRRVGYF